MNILSYSPGAKATIILETLNAMGVRADGYMPTVTRIIFPDLTLAADYPQDMTALDVGLFYFEFILPTGATAVGTYLVDVMYNEPDTADYFMELYQIIVNAPYGNFTAMLTA